MRRSGVLLFGLSGLLFGPVAPLAAQQQCPAGKTALVLAGGGAKGILHLGVIRILDSLGIRPDMVVGTSMGAIIGALYASGYSSREIDSLALSVPMADLVRPRTESPSRAYPNYRPLVSWEIDDGHVRLAPSSVHEQGVDAALNRVLLRANLQARGDFTRLPIPFYAVATDLATQQPVAIRSGDLVQAVRASMAIPLIFQPVKVGDRTLGDGGLAANVPVRVARSLGATQLIISDLVRKQAGVPDFGNPLTVATAMIDYLFSQAGDSAFPGDIAIETDVTGIGNLDFSPLTRDTLVVRGIRTARAALVGHGDCLPHGPAPRPASDSTGERVTDLRVPGFRRQELEELLGTLGLAPGILIEPRVLERGFSDFARDGRFRSVWLNPTPRDSGVALDLRVRRAPMGSLGVGIAYDNELGARMWTGGVLRDPVTRTFELTGILSFGGLRRDLQLAARRRIYFWARPTFLVGAQAGQEELQYFTAEGSPVVRPRVSLASGTVGFEWSIGPSWLVRVAGKARAWSDTSDVGHGALGGTLLAQRATEDGEILSAVELDVSREFRRVAVEWREPVSLGRLILTPGLRAGMMRGIEIPPTEMFALGGQDGFPGLHLMERRGANEAVATLSGSYRLTGPVRLRFEVSGGDVRADSSGMATDLFRGDRWLLGWRVGLGIPSSPLGPVRLEYGATSVNGDYRDRVVLRVGRWF